MLFNIQQFPATFDNGMVGGGSGVAQGERAKTNHNNRLIKQSKLVENKYSCFKITVGRGTVRLFLPWTHRQIGFCSVVRFNINSSVYKTSANPHREKSANLRNVLWAIAAPVSSRRSNDTDTVTSPCLAVCDNLYTDQPFVKNYPVGKNNTTTNNEQQWLCCGKLSWKHVIFT